ncbi:MAG: DUF2461 domain-containing protein [Ferruginibacter sp.]
MIEQSTLKFLSDLKKNNTKEWFDTNRKKYESAKEDVNKAIERLIKAIGAYDEHIATLQAKECTFRINRDIRFAKDKTPYKTNIAGYFSKGGKKSDAAGYYLHIEPGKAFAAAGCWWPEAKQLASIRQEIDYNFDEWKKIIFSAKFKAVFAEGVSQKDSLQRAPKGYEESNPAIAFIKLKSFVVYRQLSDAELTDKNFVKNIASIFKASKPMVDFLNRAETDH